MSVSSEARTVMPWVQGESNPIELSSRVGHCEMPPRSMRVHVYTSLASVCASEPEEREKQKEGAKRGETRVHLYGVELYKALHLFSHCATAADPCQKRSRVAQCNTNGRFFLYSR